MTYWVSKRTFSWTFPLFHMPKDQFSYFPYRTLVSKKYLVWCLKPSIASVGALQGRHHHFAYLCLCVCVCLLMLCINMCQSRSTQSLSVNYTLTYLPIFGLTWCLYRLPGWCWRGARPLRHPPRWWGGAGTEPRGPQTALLPPWSHDHLAAGDVWEEWDEKRREKRKYDTTEEVGFNVWLNRES